MSKAAEVPLPLIEVLPAGKSKTVPLTWWRRFAQVVSLAVLGQWSFYGIGQASLVAIFSQLQQRFWLQVVWARFSEGLTRSCHRMTALLGFEPYPKWRCHLTMHTINNPNELRKGGAARNSVCSGATYIALSSF